MSSGYEMQADEGDEGGYDGYYDERIEGLKLKPSDNPAARMFGSNGHFGIGAMGGVSYVSGPQAEPPGQSMVYEPNLSPVGSGSAGDYYPGDTYDDAKALEYLGYRFPNVNNGNPATGGAEFEGTSGSADEDASGPWGAWSPIFQAAVSAFQSDHGLPVDGWIGPVTRAAIATAIGVKGNVAPPGPNPLPPPPEPPDDWHPNNLPGPGPTPKQVSTGGTSTGTYIAIGVGALALLGLGWALTSD